MNPLPFPPKVRLALYYVYGVGSLIVTYLAAKSVIGGEEVAIWSGLGVLFGLTAAVNTHPDARQAKAAKVQQRNIDTLAH